MKSLKQRLRGSGWTPGAFARDDFDPQVSNGIGDAGQLNTTGEMSVIMTLQVERAVALRDDPDADLQLALTTSEMFTTSGNGSQETFNLQHAIAETPSTEALVLYSVAGDTPERVQADSVDYSADSFTYTDSGTAEDLVAYYVPRTPAEVEIRKVVSDGRVNIRQKLWAQNTAILHTRDQIEQSLNFDVSGSDMERYIPRKSTIEIAVKAPYRVILATTDTEAPNALVSLPKFQTEQRVEGLLPAVKEDAANIGSMG
ncbi:hypothetical protein [Halostella salina]|uniref:hypothetical protein n=1 Tax=Halostella salina TaxID=1547897 RepID=UPI0013CEC79A|nr:hypothetical protein [Halostella salina]